MTHKHIKRHTTPAVIKEMHTETTMKYHFTITRMAKIKKLEHKYVAGGKENSRQPLWKIVWQFLKC